MCMSGGETYCEGLNWCTHKYFRFLNTYKYYKALQVLASMPLFFICGAFYHFKKQLKIGCSGEVEVELMSAIHSMVDSKRSEKNL